jgi:hypothetical protein
MGSFGGGGRNTARSDSRRSNQKMLERRRARETRQANIFRVLTTSRFVLTNEHVTAFNSVPIEFYSEGDILAAWRAYLAHMSVVRPVAPSQGAASWDAKRIDLFLAMLQKMADLLGYKYDFVQLKDDWYRPQGHGDLETADVTIRRGLADLLDGKIMLPLDVKGMPVDGRIEQRSRGHQLLGPHRRLGRHRQQHGACGIVGADHPGI